MKTVEIKNIRGNLLNNVEILDDTPKNKEIKVALEKLVRLGVNLIGINLEGVNLIGINLEGANLIEANLEGANLTDVDLYRANLVGTYLIKAKLIDAYLEGANLYGADLEGATIKESVTLLKGGYFTVTNIGSEQGALEIFNTNQGLYFKRSCFFGNEEEFRAAITDKHGDNQIAKVYLHMIAGAKLRFNIN